MADRRIVADRQGIVRRGDVWRLTARHLIVRRATASPAGRVTAGTTRRVIAGLLLISGMALAAVIGAAPGHAEVDSAPPSSEAVSTTTRYQVTLVARACQGYAQLMAGRVRADDAEVAGVPGRDSGYAPGQLVDPDVEARGGAGCEPMADWRFTLGTGRQRRGALSSVTGVSGEVGPTKAAVPRLDGTGQPTAAQPGSGQPGSGQQASGQQATGSGDGVVAGAVTLSLNEDQVTSAMRRELWVQGGRPNDPLLGRTDLEFGALRCGVDGRSGSNTAWIGFPAGVRHVYCYAYYVRGVPRHGTIVVRAKATRPVGYPQRFAFTASFSTTPTRTFTLAAGAGTPGAGTDVGSGTAGTDAAGTGGDAAEASFVRTPGADQHQLTAQVPAGWKVADLGCSVTRPGAGRTASGGPGPAESTTSVSIADGRVTLTLASAETITCTYTFQPPQQRSGLSLRLYSDGGGGQFGLKVAGNGGEWALTAAPAGDGSAVTATGTDLGTAGPGSYAVTVAPPEPAGGAAWSLSGASCSGIEVKPSGLSVSVPVTAGVPVECVLRMVRLAGLRLRAATTGAAATTAVAVEPAGDLATGWTATAATKPSGVSTATSASGQPVDAEGLPASLPAGEYVLTPLAPQVTSDVGWRLVGLACEPATAGRQSGLTLGPAGAGSPGALIVTVTAGAAAPSCLVSYQATPATRLDVVLRSSGVAQARTGATIVEVSCADGAHGRVVQAADEFMDQRLPESLSFLFPTRCTITQTATGVSGDGEVATTATLEPAPGNAPLPMPAAIVIGRETPRYTVTVTNAFEAVIERPRSSMIHNPFRTLPVMLVGSGLVGLGTVALLAVLARRHRLSGPVDGLTE